MMESTGNENNSKEEQDLREGNGEAMESSSSSSFLQDLNLLFVLLSLISPDSNEDSNVGNGESMRMKELEVSTTYNIARSSVRKKDVIEAKHESRRRLPQKSYTTVKDHRFSSIYKFLINFHSIINLIPMVWKKVKV